VAVPPLLGFAFLALVAEVVLVGLGPDSSDIMVRDSLVTAIVFVAAVATLLAGVSRPAGSRAPWIMLGLGILSYACAFLLFFFFQKTLNTFPSPADFFWLSFYPFVIATIALLVRRQRRLDRLGISLDAAIIALAIGALGYELIFNGLIDLSRASDIVPGQLTYTVLDLTVLVTLILVCAPSRARAGRAYLAFGAGMLFLLGGDILLVREASAGTYVPGTLLDAAWPAGFLLLALGANLDSSLGDVNALRGRALYRAIVLSFITSFGLLIHESLGARDPIVMALTALVPCLIMIRLVASVRENDRLMRDNEAMISAAGEGIFRSDLKGRITYANPTALEMLGYSAPDVLGRRAHELIHHTRPNGTPYPACECPAATSLRQGTTQRVTDELFWHKDGSSVPVDYTVAPIREGGRIVGAVTVFDDVTHQRQMKEQLRHQADHDSLTGVYNRRRLEAEISGQMSYAQRYSHPGALLLMDLDSFKFVNDSYGHPVGDRLLCDVAGIVVARVRETDVVARIGGDEFAVLLREADEAAAVEVAKELIAAIRDQSGLSVGASFGIAPFDGTGERTPDELLIAADVALYEAKEAGGGSAMVYSGQNSRALTWVERIRRALDEDRLIVYSQPIVDLATGQVVREELLVRMLDPNGDRIPPDSFLPTAERFGLIHEIDLKVLSRAIELVADGTSVAVNVSARTLTDRRYLAALEQALASGSRPDRFNFEITETAAVANMAEAQQFAGRISELGCSLALDDFGTGFSSFTYLKHIPAQYLKIDIEFIRELERNPADQQLVRAIVAIARGLGQKTVAEGIEDAGTLAMVRELGVDYAQGFHVGRPSAPDGARPEPAGETPGTTSLPG
jgi:diguanylate cyclase (GGDEF)-like protein/PAS domain S-box-containing protein